MKLTFGLLDDFITVIKHSGTIRITWTEKVYLTDYSRTLIVDEYTELDDLKMVPEDIGRNAIYVQFPGEPEVTLDEALQYIAKGVK